MITKELRIEAFTPEGLQFPLPARNARVSKAFSGGEDMSLSFNLDRDPRINYRDVAYGSEVILRRGLNPVFKGEMRSITQGQDTLTIGCVGQWIHLDDKNEGGQGRLWCDNRYKLWQETTRSKDSSCWPERFEMDNRARLFIAPRKHERFSITGYYGEYYYYCPYDEIVRVSFDYEFIDPDSWALVLYRNNGTPWAIGADTLEWLVNATSIGVKDITLTAPSQFIRFRMYYATLEAEYTGETGACRSVITNLRVWGQTTESPSVIHVIEDVVGEVGAPLDTNTDDVLELMPVRDTFTDANGTLLVNHLPDKDGLRGGWTMDMGAFDIQANQANGTVVAARAVIDAGISDGVVCRDVTTPGAGSWRIGIMFRRVDANNYWRWLIRDTGAAELDRVVAAAVVNIYSGAIGIEAGYTYHLMVKLRGPDINCYIGGILRTTTNDTTHQAATHHGMIDMGVINMRSDNFEVYEAHPLWPLFYEQGESCYQAARDSASFGDWNYRALGWGVRTGSDRVFVREANRESVRYVVPAQFCRVLSSRGETQRDFYTSGWARYIDEEGLQRFTDKYYAHVTNGGLVVNTTATGNDLASGVYGVDRDHVFDFGRVDAELAVEYLIKALQEQGHPQVKSTIDVYGPVQDLHRGGAWIEPVEMEMGYLVRIPWFRAKEAEGIAGSDLRDWETTFLMVGLEADLENGTARLIPEGAQEDLQRMIKAARAVVEQDEKKLASKRSTVIGG